MKKLYLPCLILLSLVGNGLQAEITSNCCLVDCIPDSSCDREITSRSYFSVRPPFQSASPEMVSAFRSERTHAKEDGFGGAAELVIFGGNSTNPDDLARFFFVGGKTVMIVDERPTCVIPPANQVACQPRDLLAQHFNIFTVDGVASNGGFRSKIAIAPKQSQIGAGFYLRQSFCQNEDKGRGFFWSMSFPILSVKNKIDFREDIIDDGGGAALTTPSGGVNKITNDVVVANMTQAFEQEDWRAGKIDTTGCCPQHKTGVADMELKVGYEWLEHDPCHLETYLGLKVPTGNKPTGEYMFEPVVGNGRHWGIMWGNAVGVEIWKDEGTDRHLRVEANTHAQYLFRNTQCRSVDLMNKPWSRYIQMYQDINQAVTASNFTGNNSVLSVNYSTPGINLLTIPLNVRPGFSYNTTGCLLFRTSKFQIEGGYNLYCRQSECIKLPCPWVEGPAIKHIAGAGQTNPLRDITGNFRIEQIAPSGSQFTLLGDYKFNLIKEADLDLISASNPCIISHTLYASLGWNWNDRKYPFFINGGGSYEFSHSNNAVMERWLGWIKGGLSF